MDPNASYHLGIVCYLRGETNLSGKSFNSFSLATSAIGPNNITGLVKPGCLRRTFSYAGNLETVSENRMSSQCSFPKLLDLLLELRLLLKKLPLDSFADISFFVALNWAVASSSARALFGIMPFCTSWLLRPKMVINIRRTILLLKYFDSRTKYREHCWFLNHNLP